MSKVLAYRYDCLHKDAAILAAKLHDIGKIEEYFVDATFNKIGQIREITEPNTWAEYDRRIGVRLYI